MLCCGDSFMLFGGFVFNNSSNNKPKNNTHCEMEIKLAASFEMRMFPYYSRSIAAGK
jgi:hypothetical protein